jgi:hypothetical protein
MLPSFLLCLLLTLLSAGGAVFLVVRYDLPSVPARYTVYAFIGSVWLFQLLRWGYRMMVWTYRLTTRRLFLEWTFWNAPNLAIELRHISQVTVERTAWERWTGVGRLRIVSSNGTRILQGVRQPDHVAATLQALMDQAQPGPPASRRPSANEP